MRKNNDVFVDYKHLKTCVSIIMVLDHYGWVRELKGTGNTVRSCCPIHNGSNDKQFVVNIRNNTWCCFGDCRKGGSILELVAELEKIEIREAAVRIASWFPLSLPHSSARSSIVMSDNQKPTHKVFVVEERGEGRRRRCILDARRIGLGAQRRQRLQRRALRASGERPPRAAHLHRGRRQRRQRQVSPPRRLQETITVATDQLHSRPQGGCFVDVGITAIQLKFSGIVKVFARLLIG